MNSITHIPDQWDDLLHLFHTDYMPQPEPADLTPALTSSIKPRDIYNKAVEIELNEERLKESYIELVYVELEHKTNKAVLVTLVAQDTGEALSRWFPKAVCRNMNATQNCMYVWVDFLEDNFVDYRHYIKQGDTNG